MNTVRSTGGCPYDTLPETAFWSRAVARIDPSAVEPMGPPPFSLLPTDPIATAGSCFAQHIGARLDAAGFNYLITEDAPASIPTELRRRYGFGVFSGRFGNIYTARQLLQLLRRIRGQWQPKEPFWRDGERWIDPFRPFIQPRGFATKAELLEDRAQHEAAVLRMFETARVFIFTLGLTEAWCATADGAVFPGCPGCSAGSFDADRYHFHNFDYEEVLTDLRAFLCEVRAVNPGLRVILTVSPVPLIATADDKHVLTATTYSKSVLRAVAGKIESELRDVIYFPAYEIVTSQSNRGRYFADDLRSVTDEGVDHVMRVFFASFCDGTALPKLDHARDEDTEIARLMLVCDEEMLSVGEP